MFTNIWQKQFLTVWTIFTTSVPRFTLYSFVGNDTNGFNTNNNYIDDDRNNDAVHNDVRNNDDNIRYDEFETY